MKRSLGSLIKRLSGHGPVNGAILAVALTSLAGCNPRVEIAAPEKPITINMNVKIDHEVRVKVERDLEEVISKDSELF